MSKNVHQGPALKTSSRSQRTQHNARSSEASVKRRLATSVPALDSVGRAKSKKDMFNSMENLSKETNPSGRPTNQPTPKMKCPAGNVLERHSIGSPLKVATPSKSQMRSLDTGARIGTPEVYSAVRFDTPRRNVVDPLGAGVEKSNLVVAVRVRPLSAKEEEDSGMRQLTIVKDNEVTVATDYGPIHTFSYDHCFSSSNPRHRQYGDQARVYESLAKPLLANAFKGFNTCLFAYGQTGSGKSYSVMGTIDGEKELHESAGIVPRFCHDLFRKMEVLKKSSTNKLSIQVQISYFEIYKEKIQDLLCPKVAGNLRVREHPQTGPYVVDLSQHAVGSFEEVQRWLLVGNRQRATAATSANERSSRSHAIFTITLAQGFEEKIDGQAHEVRMQSRINFIDLAGSERVASVQSVGDRREEGLTINQSLLTLGRVITALAEHTFVPYRESVLTWLLKESLGGDSKTVMLATVSPCAGHLEETLSTLRYACQARTIINTARICEDPNARLIRHLREQIKTLEQRVASDVGCPAVNQLASEDTDESAKHRVEELENEIKKLKGRLAEVICQKDISWQSKVAEAEVKRAEAEKALASYGLSAVKDADQPCLVNVNQDPMLSGTLFYPLKPGCNWVGPPECSADPPAIQLTGLLIEVQHCCIESANGVLKLTAKAETYVNGQQVSSPVHLHHGDRIIVAGTHFFHLHYPNDGPLSRRMSTKVPDFHTAYEELRLSQEERLKAAIREAQEKTRSQLLSEMEEFRTETALEMSLQRQSYEDEIADLNRMLFKERNLPDSPPSPLTLPTKSAVHNEIESLLRDLQSKITQPPQEPGESSFVVQSMLNEGNAICRRLQAPYTFARKDTLGSEGIESAICVQDLKSRLFMQWNVQTMKHKLEVMREAVEEARKFPADVIFDRSDKWQSMNDESLSLMSPIIRDTLEKIHNRHDGTHAFDESYLDSSKSSGSRRSSFMPRSPPNPTAMIADICKDLVSSFPCANDSASIFFGACSSLKSMFDHPDRTSAFSLSLACQTSSLMSVFPGYVQELLAKREVPSDVRLGWLASARELVPKLQNAIVFILQGIALDSNGLFLEWVDRAQESVADILSLVCELIAVYCTEMPALGNLSAPLVVPSFASAQSRIHQAVINLADDVRMKIAQLPDECSMDSTDGSSSINNGWLVKACHDSVTQIQILLERCSGFVANPQLFVVDTSTAHAKFHNCIDVLLRLVATVENLLAYLEQADLAQIKFNAAALEVQMKTYIAQMDLNEEIFLGDLSFAVGMVHKIVAERRRMMVLLRGRDMSDIAYSPLPTRLLASPSRKRISHFDDQVIDSDSQSSPFDATYSDESLENVSISPSAIQRALEFHTPSKSSLKTNAESRFHGKNVRFLNVTNSPTPSS